MATNPTLITTPFAQSGDKTTPPNTNVPSDGRFSQTLGFPPVTAIPLGSGGKAPKREDFNGAFNMLANIIFYAQKGWIFQWDSSQSYYAGCIVRYSGNLYSCTSDVTSTTNPASDTSHWSKYNISPGTTYAPINSPAFTGTPTAPTPSSGDNSTKLATTAFVSSAISGVGGGNIGDIVAFAGSGTPSGFLLCDGSAVSRSTYSDLFAVIGTTYGSGDGSTTFNLPNIINKFLQGASTPGTTKSAGLPNIKGRFSVEAKVGAGTITNLYTTYNASTDGGYNGSGANPTGVELDASRVSSVYSDSVTTVQPPALTTRFIIRYE